METCVNNVIEELSKINDAAAGYAENMEEAMRKLEKEFTAKKDAFDVEQGSSVTEHLDNLKARLTKENDEKIESLHRDYEIYMKKVEESFEANHEKWAQEIAEKIISERL